MVTEDKRDEVSSLRFGKISVDYMLEDSAAEQVVRHYTDSPLAHGDREHGALCAIEQILGVSLTRQYQAFNYRIDGYDATNNVAYEIDEPQHYVGGQLKTECADRQQAIEGLLGCRVVRIRV